MVEHHEGERMKLRKGLAAAFVVALGLAACSSGGDDTTGGEISADTEGTLKVWLMDGSQPDSVIEATNAKFNEAYPNVDVQVEIQQWGGIQDKLTTSLGTDSTPDIVEIGNSLTAKYADAGLLAELDPGEFAVDGMLPGLQPSGELDGVRYGIPYYGGVRIVVYKKSDFAAANVEVPTSLEELNAAAAALQAANASNPKYSAFYFPGKYWYGAVPFVWDAGGEIAEEDGGQWTGLLDSTESQAGLTTLKNLVDKYSQAPKDGDETKNVDAFNTGNIGMMIDSWWAPGTLDKEGAPFAGDIGVFAMPGTTPGTTAPVFFGGSDLAVSFKSKNQQLAAEWLKIITGEEIQAQLAEEGGVIPNQEAAFAGHEGDPFLQVADEASTNSRFTPVSPNWANVESSAVLQDMLVKIFTNQASVAEATKEASDAITETLNQ
jgi:N,N'-diacetylchitobiose transport system substrate-binding protein